MYFLDTDICSDAITAHPRVLSKLQQLDRSQWAISALVEAELRFGLEKGALLPRTHHALTKFLDIAAVVPFDHRAAKYAATVRWERQRAGQPAGAIDQLIAGHAVALGWVLVTANTRHFAGISGLTLENWRN